MTVPDVECLGYDCRENGNKGICIPPAFVPLVENRNYEVITTVGYPYGYDSFNKKIIDFDVDADIFDITMDIALLKQGRYLATLHQLTRLVNHTNERVRVDIQTKHLTPLELIAALQIVEDTGVVGVILGSEVDVETDLEVKIAPIIIGLNHFPKASAFGTIYTPKGLRI